MDASHPSVDSRPSLKLGTWIQSNALMLPLKDKAIFYGDFPNPSTSQGVILGKNRKLTP